MCMLSWTLLFMYRTKTIFSWHDKKKLFLGSSAILIYLHLHAGFAKSYTGDCTVPDNQLATYINESDYTLDRLESVPDGGQLTQVCTDDNIEHVFNVSDSSFCVEGRWIPEFQNCTNSKCRYDPCHEKKALCSRTSGQRNLDQSMHQYNKGCV